MEPAKHPKLAIFSPLPPLENGIADYTAELLPWHAKDFEVTVVVEDKHPLPTRGDDWGSIRTVFLAEYLANRKSYAGHLHLYHLGNNPDHVYMLPIAMEQPGVIVLHDASLHYLLDCATLRWGDFAGYTAFLHREYGSCGRLLGEQFESHRWRERAMFYELPSARTLLNRAKGVITHSAFAYCKAKAQCPDTPVTLIPHHLTPVAEQSDSLDRAKVRKRLGLDDVELVLLSLGFITKAKQIDAVFRVLAGARDKLPPFRYVLAGARLPDQFDVDGEIARYGLDDVVTVTDYLDEAAFFEHIAAADLVINLRYPTGGETSGTLIRALGCGACVVVVDHGPFAELPDDVCVKVPWSDRFGQDLESALLDTLRSTERRQEIAARAKRFLRDRHAIQKSAEAYRRFSIEVGAATASRWGVDHDHKFFTPRVNESLLAEAGLPPSGVLWARETIVPECGGGRLVLMSGQAELHATWLARYGYAGTDIDAVAGPGETETLPNRGADVALLAGSEPDLDALRGGLAELNRLLAFGAVLVLDFVQTDFSGSGLLSKPAVIAEELARAGFSVLRHSSGGPSDVSPAVDFRGAEAAEARPFEACWQALKVSEFITPANAPLERIGHEVQLPCVA